MKCFYHSADLDGHCSGAIAKRANPHVELVGMDYGQPFPWERLTDPTEHVVMIDFSLQPFEDMVRLNGLCRLIWIDHHKSAILDWEEFNRPIETVKLSTEFAACELAWQTFFPNLPMPLAVHWTGRYDIWKHAEAPGALEFQYGMKLKNTWPDNQLLWPILFEHNEIAEAIRDDGTLLLAYERVQNEKFIQAYGFEVEFEGLKCIAANRGMSNSLLFESVWNHEKYDAMLMFAWKNGQFTVSLYTDKPGIDVSVICKAHGGGGHKGAAGFQCKDLPFISSEAATG